MKDYASMSDREIAEKIGKAIGLGNIGGCLYIKNGVWTRFDPCNNPADAWPIITENNISLIFDNPSMPMATSNCVGWYSDEEPPIHASSLNPLRAAMIVFLMMKEGE